MVKREVVLADLNKVQLVGLLNKKLTDTILNIDRKVDNEVLKNTLLSAIDVLEELYTKC